MDENELWTKFVRLKMIVLVIINLDICLLLSVLVYLIVIYPFVLKM